jgi:hypothetical protein
MRRCVAGRSWLCSPATATPPHRNVDLREQRPADAGLKKLAPA